MPRSSSTAIPSVGDGQMAQGKELLILSRLAHRARLSKQVAVGRLHQREGSGTPMVVMPFSSDPDQDP